MSDLTELREAIAQHDDGEAGTHQYSEIVSAARLVASGEVVAKTDLREIRWCETHEQKASGEWCIYAAWEVKARGSCRIVSAGLYLEGETE